MGAKLTQFQQQNRHRFCLAVNYRKISKGSNVINTRISSFKTDSKLLYTT